MSGKKMMILMILFLSLWSCGGGGGSDGGGSDGGGTVSGDIDSNLIDIWLVYEDQGLYRFSEKVMEVETDGRVWWMKCDDNPANENCAWYHNHDDLEATIKAASGGRLTMVRDGDEVNARYDLHGDILTLYEDETGHITYMRRGGTLIGCLEIRNTCEAVRAPCILSCNSLSGSAWTACVNQCQTDVDDCYVSNGGDPRGLSCDDVNWCACDW